MTHYYNIYFLIFLIFLFLFFFIIVYLTGRTTVAVAATVATVGALFFGLMGLWVYYTYWKYCKSISKQAVYACDFTNEGGKDNIPDHTSEVSDLSSTVDCNSETPAPDLADYIAPHMVIVNPHNK
jgi:hypothetical protein